MRNIGKLIGLLSESIWNALTSELEGLWRWLLYATIPAAILANLPIERIWRQWPVEWTWTSWIMAQLGVYLIFRIFYLQRRAAK